MSIFSESATSGTVSQFCRYIEAELQTATDPVAIATLKRAGRFALTCFEWDTPEWAKAYEARFADPAVDAHAEMRAFLKA